LLSAVLGNLDVALLDLPASSHARQGVEQAIVASRRAAHLTNQILAYTGKSRFTVSRVDISELVRDNVNLFRTAIPRRISLNLSVSPQPSIIEADPSQMQQVIMNLITNASEAIGERTGEINLITGVEYFEPDYLSRSRIKEKPVERHLAYLEVSDTGYGMDEETQQRLFDPFFTTKSTGRGLGMSVVLGIVRGHRGAILVNSARGQGTTIRVLFPAWSQGTT
jgi:signal transduction histidine kinase